MDGVILGMPPADPTERANHCRAAETCMWCKAGESAAPDLSGGSKYGRQIPLNRAVGLWGGISGGGFAEVFFHNTKKVNTKEWVCALQAGALTTAIKSLGPVKPHGPWHVLCDNESFLTAKDASREYLGSNASLWQIPARSPTSTQWRIFGVGCGSSFNGETSRTWSAGAQCWANMHIVHGFGQCVGLPGPGVLRKILPAV